MIKKGEIIELGIDKMAFGGQAVARLDGFVVFVKGGVPGDRLTARIYKKKKDYAEARLVELIGPSPDRVEAPCPYSGHCGGCQWQHVRYESQLGYKKQHVEESMSHIGALEGVLVRDVLPSDRIFSYRNKMEFSFSDRRWLLPDEFDGSDNEAGFALGLHAPGTYSKVIDMDACLLQMEEGNRILRLVKEYARKSGMPVYGIKSHEGFWRFVTIRHSTAFDQWMVNIVTSEERPSVLRPLVEKLVGEVPDIISIVNNISRKKAAIAVGQKEIVLFGGETIRDMIGPFIFHVSANSFFQTNSQGAQKLYQCVKDLAEFKGNETVLDLYSGTGTIPIFVADKALTVTGIEIAESAVLDARKNCEENGVTNCRFICGDIRDTLSSIDLRPDVLIIDPPRAGMHKEVLAQVMALAPDRIIYVSCNPATMARDLAQMVRDYEVIEIQPVDMFPHTYHIESVAKLKRRGGARS
ncbi:putative enzyme [uncultured Desulfobacterium sp.]|uniref:Putative enzyme n=1 Tax=uncultured Desulfobacterium sp. TaxID=201089 RepID=A0A445MSF2_9BACT|nr:putative enzyme [uncultured Desulfobacterium sp.]